MVSQQILLKSFNKSDLVLRCVLTSQFFFEHLMRKLLFHQEYDSESTSCEEKAGDPGESNIKG